EFLSKYSSNLFAGVDGCDVPAIADHVRVSVREDHQIAGFEHKGLFLVDPDITLPFRKQVVDDNLAGARSQMWGEIARRGRTEAPRRRKFTVKEDCTLQFD